MSYPRICSSHQGLPILSIRHHLYHCTSYLPLYLHKSRNPSYSSNCFVQSSEEKHSMDTFEVRDVLLDSISLHSDLLNSSKYGDYVLTFEQLYTTRLMSLPHMRVKMATYGFVRDGLQVTLPSRRCNLSFKTPPLTVERDARVV